MQTCERTKDQRIELARLMLEAAFRCLVNDPDAVEVRAILESRQVVFLVSVADDDKGRAIGKRGAYKRLLEDLLQPIGGNHQLRYLIERIQ